MIQVVLKFALGVVLSAWLAPSVLAADRLKVVASFSILGDMVKQIGGDAVDITVLVGANEDAHVYRPSPRVARQIQQADLVVLNGLGFEGWFARLLQASGYQGPVVIASQGIEALYGGHDHSVHHDHGTQHDHHTEQHSGNIINPHAWHSLANATIYVRNIEQALASAYPEKADYFQQRSTQYQAAIQNLDSQIARQLSVLEGSQWRVISTHDAYGYITKEYGIEFLSPQGLSTEAEPSAKDVAQLIRQIRQQNIRALFIENVTDNRLIEQIARETGVAIRGELYSDALTDASGEAPTYLDMMRVNLSKLVSALQ